MVDGRKHTRKRGASDAAAVSRGAHLSPTRRRPANKLSKSNRTQQPVVAAADAAPQSQPTATPPWASRRQQQKRKREEEKGDARLETLYDKLLAKIVKMQLSTACEHKVLKSILIQVNFFRNESPDMKLLTGNTDLIEVYKKAVQDQLAYNKKLKKNKMTTLPSPHLFAWKEMVVYLHKLLQQLKVLEEAKDPKDKPYLKFLARALQDVQTHALDLTDQATAFSRNGIDDNIFPDALNVAKHTMLENMVKVFRIHKCWDPERSRLELNITVGTSAQPVGEILQTILERLAHGERRHGQVPRGDTKRQLQLWLNHGNNATLQQLVTIIRTGNK